MSFFCALLQPFINPKLVFCYLYFFLFFIFNPQPTKSKAVTKTLSSSLASIIQIDTSRLFCFVYFFKMIYQKRALSFGLLNLVKDIWIYQKGALSFSLLSLVKDMWSKFLSIKFSSTYIQHIKCGVNVG